MPREPHGRALRRSLPRRAKRPFLKRIPDRPRETQIVPGCARFGSVTRITQFEQVFSLAPLKGRVPFFGRARRLPSRALHVVSPSWEGAAPLAPRVPRINDSCGRARLRRASATPARQRLALPGRLEVPREAGATGVHARAALPTETIMHETPGSPAARPPNSIPASNGFWEGPTPSVSQTNQRVAAAAGVPRMSQCRIFRRFECL